MPSYTPYGFHPEHGPCLLGFNGQWLDPLTGCTPLGNGYRLYSAMLNRFLSPDRASPFGSGGPNCYAYCQGDPVNRFDPTGRSGRRPRLPGPSRGGRRSHRPRVPYARGVGPSNPLPAGVGDNRPEIRPAPPLNQRLEQVPAQQAVAPVRVQPAEAIDVVGRPAAGAGQPVVYGPVTLEAFLGEVVKMAIDLISGGSMGYNDPSSPGYRLWMSQYVKYRSTLSAHNQLLAEVMHTYASHVENMVIGHVDQARAANMGIRFDE